MSRYESVSLPMVEADGQVPASITTTLAFLPKVYQHRMRVFLDETCQALADSRAQVLADRAELDGWRNRYRSEQQSA